ncbi:MAG: SDR family oxidoreductase [Bacteroidota bacterium]
MNKKAIFLGGTKGLGLSLAKKAAHLGMKPIILGSSAQEEEVSKDFPDDNEAYTVDLCNMNDVDGAAYGTGSIDYLFWISGVFLKKPLNEVSDFEIRRMTDIHFLGPVTYLRNFLKVQTTPFHLITIASCSSWRLRKNESLYTGLKAAQACFSRNLAEDIAEQLPGSKSLLINPGGLNTPNFWKNENIDTAGFLNPDKVADIIWDHVLNQKTVFQEVQILRKKPVVIGSDPIIKYGPQKPEIPT